MKKMKKRIFAILIALMLTLSASVSVFAAIPGYGIFVGGFEVTASNASDVLGNGTVSYDAATNTLTLNGANITECYTAEIFTSGIYTEIADLTVNLVGENRITVPIRSASNIPDGDEVAIASTKSIEISGTGKLWSNTYVVTCMQDIAIKNCEISSDWICISAMSDVTVEDATISGKVGLVNTMTGDITLKNTNVPDGGNYIGIYTETGDVTIDNCNVTIHSATIEDDGVVPIAIGEGGGSFTVKNSVLDIRSNMYGILAPTSAAVFENVKGNIEVTGVVAYAMIFGVTVSMKGCDLEIVCRATEDAACGICTEQDIGIEDSKLRIDARTSDEAALCIGNLESPNANVDVWNSTLELTASGPNAVGFYANNVKLNNSVTAVTANALANGKGFAAGIAAIEGRALVNGGALEVLATGPVEHEGPATVGILMGNAILVPEFVEADVKLCGNQAICAYPDLSLYGREYELTASTEVNGESKVELTKENVASVRYLHIHPFYAINFDANGGTGEMKSVQDHYGEYTLPQNAFTAPAGKVFKGWALSPDGEVLTDASFTPHSDTDLYAIWEDAAAPTPDDTPSGDAPSSDATADHSHVFGDEWKYTEEVHYKECDCGERQHEGAHVDNNENGSCDVCGSQMPDKGCGSTVNASFILLAIGLATSIAIVGKKSKRRE